MNLPVSSTEDTTLTVKENAPTPKDFKPSAQNNLSSSEMDLQDSTSNSEISDKEFLESPDRMGTRSQTKVHTQRSTISSTTFTGDSCLDSDSSQQFPTRSRRLIFHECHANTTCAADWQAKGSQFRDTLPWHSVDIKSDSARNYQKSSYLAACLRN